MLFRRISQHIRDQNWFAVIVDFLIVVVGVFIGFQVDRLYESRREVELEASLLSELKSEFEENLALIDVEVSFRDAVLESIDTLLSASNEAPLDPAEIDELIEDLTWWGYAAFSTGALDSVLEGNTLSLIRNADLRHFLVQIPGLYQNTFLHEHVDSVREQIYPYLNENASFSQFANLQEDGRPGDGGFPAPAIFPVVERRDHSYLLEDSEFIGILTQQYWDHLDAKGAYEIVTETILSAISIIEAEIGTTP